MLLSDDLYQALLAAGIFQQGDQVRRFVIDARKGQAVRMFVERAGDQQLQTILPQELQQLDSGNIFATAPELRQEAGPALKEREVEQLDAPAGGPQQGDREVDNSGEV